MNRIALSNILYPLLMSFFVVSIGFPSCQNKQENTKEVVTEAKNIPEKSKQDKEDKNNGKKIILFFGNSLTAGYGLEEEASFPSLIQNKIDAAKLDFKVVNAGISGETTADGKARIDWVLRQKVDIFVLELGANDMLRGFDVNETRKNLNSILKSVKANNPETEIIIAGMKAAPNLGENYVKAFDDIFPALAKTYNAKLIPFLLDGVAAIPSLNLKDGKHPNIEGQKLVAENVWKVLKTLI